MKSTLFTLCLLGAACSLAPAQNAADWATIESEVATGDDLHFVRPADLKASKPVALLLKNGSDAPVRAQLSLGVKERSDAFVPLVARGEIEIPAQGQISLPLSAAQIGSRLGVKYVDWKLTGGGRNASGHASFALMNPVGITPGVQRGEFILAIRACAVTSIARLRRRFRAPR